MQRAGGYEPVDLTSTDLLEMFGHKPEIAPPPVLSIEDERAQMERDSYAFAAQMKRGSS